MEPDAVEILEELAVERSRVGAIETLSERHDHRVWRVVIDDERRVLKWLPDDAASREIGGFELLRRCGVPTLPIYGQSRNALLLEDLASSAAWRLADAQDVDSPRVGAAVADWYCALHVAGEKLLAEGCPAFLRRESDELTPDAIRGAARSLGCADAPVWDLAAEHVELLRAAEARLSFTLNYQDFHWSNLALSRAQPLTAIVFDYDQLCVGMRYSDCRNVVGSLGPAAREAFWRRYGRCDEREMVIDPPLACLYALLVGSRRPSLPKWAAGILSGALDGKLERDLARAPSHWRGT